MAFASGCRVAHVLDSVHRFLHDDTCERSNRGNALQATTGSTVNKQALVVTNNLCKGLDVVNHIVATVLGGSIPSIDQGPGNCVITRGIASSTSTSTMQQWRFRRRPNSKCHYSTAIPQHAMKTLSFYVPMTRDTL